MGGGGVLSFDQAEQKCIFKISMEMAPKKLFLLLKVHVVLIYDQKLLLGFKHSKREDMNKGHTAPPNPSLNTNMCQ